MDNTSSQDETAVDVDVVRETLDKKTNITLVDVRTPEEYAEGYIAGSVLVPLQDLQGAQEQLGKIPDKEKTLYVHCKRGVRGAQAVDILRSLGYKDVHNVTGGIEAWTEKGFPTVK